MTFLRKYKKGDEKQVFALWKKIFGKLLEKNDIFEINQDWWNWRILKNPGGFPDIFISEKEKPELKGKEKERKKEIVAHQMIEKFRLSDNQKIYLSGLTMCDKNYRGLDLLKLINNSTKKIKKEGSIGYGLPNLDSLEIFERFKWKNIGEIPILVRPLNFFFRIFNIKNIWQGKNGYEIKKIKKFDKRITKFNKEFDEKNYGFKYLIKRDEKTLNWKYCENPQKQYEKRIVLDENKEIKGYCVFRCTEINNKNVGIILDIFAKDKHGFNLLVQEIVNYFSKQKIKFISCFMIKNNFFYDCLRKNGFFQVPSFLLPKKNVLVILNNEKEQEILNIKNWYISYGDWDCF